MEKLLAGFPSLVDLCDKFFLLKIGLSHYEVPDHATQETVSLAYVNFVPYECIRLVLISNFQFYLTSRLLMCAMIIWIEV